MKTVYNNFNDFTEEMLRKFYSLPGEHFTAHNEELGEMMDQLDYDMEAVYVLNRCVDIQVARRIFKGVA